jgi:hypothetical protein
MTKAERERFDGLEARLERIERRLDREKGFVGGVIFAVSALWAVVTFLFAYYRGH